MADFKSLSDLTQVATDFQAGDRLFWERAGAPDFRTYAQLQSGVLGANLTSLSGLTLAADRGLYSTGADTLALFTLTAAGRALLDDADAAAQRTTLGLGTAALMADSADTDLTVAPDGAARRDIVKAYVDGLAIGVGQTWQDVSASRAHSTSYQNSTGRPIDVAISLNTSSAGREIQVSTDNATWVAIHVISSTNAITNPTFTVPPGHYYRINVSATIQSWVELR